MGGLQYERACTFTRLCETFTATQDKTRPGLGWAGYTLQPPTQSRLGWLSSETGIEGRDNEDKYDNQVSLV